MMNTELKFKVWDKVAKAMSPEFHLFGEFTLMGAVHDWQREVRLNFDPGDSLGMLNDLIELQWTGLLDKNGKEIYEGDIFRVEEDAEDLIYYLVIVWVQEWAMFCTLRVEDEYQAYLNGGIKELDEPMFWTYTLEDTNDRRFFLCGNIYANPELLTTQP